MHVVGLLDLDMTWLCAGLLFRLCRFFVAQFGMPVVSVAAHCFSCLLFPLSAHTGWLSRLFPGGFRACSILSV